MASAQNLLTWSCKVLRYGPLRLVGLSGIFNRSDYTKPHHERPPYSREDVRSIYHVRESDVSKLLQVSSPVDIGVSHDWPRRIEYFGDCVKLFTDRPSLFDSAKVDNLGSAPAEQLLNRLRPSHWFSGHIHVKYNATVQHRNRMRGGFFQDLAICDELLRQLPKSVKRMNAQLTHPSITNQQTLFLALDKPGPDHEFLELLEVDSCWDAGDESTKPYLQKASVGKYALHYDEEWLSILRLSVRRSGSAEDKSTERELEETTASGTDVESENFRWIQDHMTAKGLLRIPENFQRHAHIYYQDAGPDDNTQPQEFRNSQTQTFCKMMQIKNISSLTNDVAGDDNHVVFE